MYINVLVPDKLIYVEGQEPLVVNEIKYPLGVTSIYYDTNKGEGYMQFEDPSLELKPVIEADLTPYLKAYNKKAKELSRKSRSTRSSVENKKPLPKPIDYLEPPEKDSIFPAEEANDA